MSQQHQSVEDEVRPIEEVAGDAMGALLQFALRNAKHHFGEARALRAMDEIEAGRARLHAAVDIGQTFTRLRCTLVPNDPQEQPHVIADMDLIRPQSTH